MPRVPKILNDDHVFPDGQTFKNVRDAIVAASKTGMWHVSHDMSLRYNLQDWLCTKCGKATGAQHTYYMYRERAIRICLKCNSGGTTIPR